MDTDFTNSTVRSGLESSIFYEIFPHKECFKCKITSSKSWGYAFSNGFLLEYSVYRRR